MQKIDRVLRVILRIAVIGGLVNSFLLVRLFMNDMVFPNSNEKTLLQISSTSVVILSIIYLILCSVNHRS